MDRNGLASKRRQESPQPAKQPLRLSRDKKTQQDALHRTSSGRSRTKLSNEIAGSPLREGRIERPSIDSDPNTRNFTVANVGRNGTLYLKPSRVSPSHFTKPLATPPDTSDGKDDRKGEWPGERTSVASGTYTPRPLVVKGKSYNSTTPLPPLSMANAAQRKRTRSHSFSTISDAVRAPTFDSHEFQLLLNGQDAGQRPKSSVDLSGGFLDLRIPHYRLGTPRFSDMGTAYLHNSMYTSASEDMRSSLFSRAEYDSVFPAPPGKEHGRSFISRSSASPFLHPNRATYSLRSSRAPPLPPPTLDSGEISIHVYDKIEANIHDPSLVRLSYSTGRITAATPARLVVQITSPLFLDYELLSDFFLTFRCFMSSHELLKYLWIRMKWALTNDSDSGRIVTVRSFVALRHWILNYFSDDFLSDFKLRRQFCTLVNDAVNNLRRRQDRGGTNINVVSELKKCWRRTCAMFWPVADAMEDEAETDIFPGPDSPSTPHRVSATSLIQHNERHSIFIDFRRSSIIRLPADGDRNGISFDQENLQTFGIDAAPQLARTASIPASPMSELSLDVLSCSVPFLKNLRPNKDKNAPTRPLGPQKNPPISKKSPKPGLNHKRSGSFNDALNDDRSPLPSGHPNRVHISSLPSITLTGGLVRGLLLQPSPSKVNLIPTSPGLDAGQVAASAADLAGHQDRQQQNVGMKRIVGDVRRALKKDRRESPPTSRHSNSSGSRSSGQMVDIAQQARSPAMQQLQGPLRVDRLGERIEGSYQEAFQDANEPAFMSPAQSTDRPQDTLPNNPPDLLLTPDIGRLNSHVTTGSRSIVIVDDTGIPGLPTSPHSPLPPMTSWSSGVAPRPLFHHSPVFEDNEGDDHFSGGASSTAVPSSEAQPSRFSDLPLHDLLVPPQSWQIKDADGDVMYTDFAQARKSSSAQPPTIDMPQMQHQLRRRPGGDLKAADHVHDLEPAPRPETGDSYSTFSQALLSSGAPSLDPSGTQFAPDSQQTRTSAIQTQKNDSFTLLPTHSSQPNMRPSFQKQVDRLAAIHDGSHGGSIEDALARLEGKSATPGKVETPAIQKQELDPPSIARQNVPAPLHVPNPNMSSTASISIDHSDLQSPQTDRQGASIFRMSESDMQSMSTFAKREANIAESPNTPRTGMFSMLHSGLDDQSEHTSAFAEEEGDEPAPLRTESRMRSDVPPRPDTAQGSFLLDDDESLSDISTEIAEQEQLDDNWGIRSFYFDEAADEAVILNGFRAPPTPPSTNEGPNSLSFERSPAQSPTAAEYSKTLKEAASAPKLLASAQPNTGMQPGFEGLRRVNTVPSQRQTAHLPFVLGFESDVIAEQLTIIEKDALDEVDWKDLIGLNWQHAPCQSRNWVEFLKRDDCNGIDIVVSRFNLAVKWVVSECMLTEAPSERARTITKYIHIATHCHRLRNYASMYQITLALLSADMARLHKTWAFIAPAEKQMLLRLEKLCQPRGNFHQLRAEMESAATEDGCIPFIGLYTHDLMFNAQKPSRIDPTPPGRESLINFERFQTAATIVKSLLRLIEASAKYVFRPHPEVLSRCLWLAALEDKEITARSKTLEH